MAVTNAVQPAVRSALATSVAGSGVGGGVFYPELLTNTAFAGYVAGSPGTVPTGWDEPYVNGSYALPLLTLGCVADKKVIAQTKTLEVGSYAFQCGITLNSGSASIADLITAPLPLPAGITADYYVDGAAAAYTDAERDVRESIAKENVVTHNNRIH